MNVQAGFILNSILLGAGLAMDAVSVSVANGLEEPGMSGKKTAGIAGTFAFFQWLMPMLGWFFVTSLLSVFRAVDPFLPFVSFALLLYIGGKLCLEGIKGETDENPDSGLGMKALFLQGIATSIDALSVGFTLASYRAAEALLSSVLIALTTFFPLSRRAPRRETGGRCLKPPGQDTRRPHLNCHRRPHFYRRISPGSGQSLLRFPAHQRTK